MPGVPELDLTEWVGFRQVQKRRRGGGGGWGKEWNDECFRKNQ